jgi:hypothetical protein
MSYIEQYRKSKGLDVKTGQKIPTPSIKATFTQVVPKPQNYRANMETGRNEVRVGDTDRFAPILDNSFYNSAEILKKNGVVPVPTVRTSPTADSPAAATPATPKNTIPVPQGYTPKPANALTYEQAVAQARGQYDPLYNQAEQKVQQQVMPNKMNADKIAAARGGLHSGLGGELINQVNVAAQNSIADLNAQKASDIAKSAQSLVNRSEDVNFRNRQQEFSEWSGQEGLNLQRGGLTGYLPGFGQTLAARNSDRDYQLGLGQLTGNIGGTPTLQAQNQQFNQGMQREQFDRGVLESDRDFNYKTAQQEWQNTFTEGQFDFQKAQQIYENQFKEKNFQQAVKESAQRLGMDSSKMSQAEQQFAAEMAYKKEALALDKEKFEASQSPPSATPTADDHIDTVTKTFLIDEVDGTGSKTGRRIVQDPEAAERYILSLNLPDAEATKLYYLLGLPWGG